MAAIEIEEVCSITPAAAQAIAELVRQLSSSAKVPSENELEQILHSPAAILLTARASNKVVGMLTLVIFRIPTGVRGIIEDVVVDEAYRGQGIAEALAREALSRSEAVGARTVDLTSRPSREAANRLYQKLGFQKRDSNVYRFSFGEDARKSPP
jgi:ribosomal protein S18 acetylase RimI-like enzyme